MNEQQVQDFFTTNSIVGAMTPEQAASLLEGTPLQGDTVTPTEPPGGAPATPAAPQVAEPPAAPAAPAPAPAEPVVLAKDGVHTIEYAKLVEARTAAQEATARADALQAQLDAARAQAPAPAPTPAPATIDIDAKEKEWLAAVSTGDDAAALALRKEINLELMRQASAQATASLTQRQQQDQFQLQVKAAQTYAATAKQMYPQLDNASPLVNKDAVDFVLGKRERLMDDGMGAAEALQTAVDGAASLFGWKKAGAAPAPAPVNHNAAAAAAATAIAAAGEATPTTLSDIPGARVDGRSPVDQLAAVGNGPDLLAAMENMSPDRIEQFLNRSI